MGGDSQNEMRSVTILADGPACGIVHPSSHLPSVPGTVPSLKEDKEEIEGGEGRETHSLAILVLFLFSFRFCNAAPSLDVPTCPFARATPFPPFATPSPLSFNFRLFSRRCLALCSNPRSEPVSEALRSDSDSDPEGESR